MTLFRRYSCGRTRNALLIDKDIAKVIIDYS